MSLLSTCTEALQSIDTVVRIGRVTRVLGVVIEALGPNVQVGEFCLIHLDDGGRIGTEVVGFRDGRVLLMPLGDMQGIRQGNMVEAVGHPFRIPVGRDLLGRVVDGLGYPIDGRGPIAADRQSSTNGIPPEPMSRPLIAEPLSVGVRAIDGLLTLGKGQRVGIFAGSGVGKSTLLGMMVRNTSADVRVIALVGERGREVQEFLNNQLADCREKTVVVVSTSDEPPLVRLRAAFTATTIAEYFRDQGLDVLLVMDSVTRLALAQREVGLSAGEPPTTRGYPPSVFSMLPRLLERAGTASQGSITGVYTVLVEGDDMNEPIADTVRGILDGHIVLSRALAEKGHFPAIDVLASVSRLMPKIVSPAHVQKSRLILRLLADYRQVEDLIAVGAYKEGTLPNTDLAVRMHESINDFLRQEENEAAELASSLQALDGLVAGI